MWVCKLQSNLSLFIISLLTHNAGSMCGQLMRPLVFAPHLSGQYKQLAYSCNNHRCQSYKLKVLQSKVIQRHCRADDAHSHTPSIQNFVFIEMPDAAITPSCAIATSHATGTEELFSHAMQAKLIKLGGWTSRTFKPCMA